MPFRNLGEYVAKIAFTSSAEMPRLVYLACLRTGLPSNTAYYQQAVCERLAKDLDIPLQRLLDNLPPRRGPSGHLYDPDHPGGHTMGHRREVLAPTFRIGPANTDENVR